jgi:hypothetical protein
VPFGLAAVGLSLGKKLAKRIGKKNRKKIAGAVAKGKAARGKIAGAVGAAAAGGYLAGARGVGPEIVGIGPGAMGRRGPGSGGAGAMAMGVHRRYRRINPGNARAMRRAIRRVTAGAKMYSRLFGITHGRIKGARHVRIRRRKRAA